MVADMGFDIEIIGVPIMRAKDGLALSSRNGYLTAEQRKIAPGLYKVLSSIADKLQAGERDLDEIIAIAGQELNEKGFRADDIQIRDADTLLEVSENKRDSGSRLAWRCSPDRQQNGRTGVMLNWRYG